MDKFINKKYQIDRIGDGYDAFLEAIGVSAENRKLAKESKATYQLLKLSGNEYSFNTTFGPRTIETKFVLNEETERTTLDGRTVKSTITFDGNKLTERQVEPNREVTTTRVFSDNDLTVESSVGSIKSTIWCVLVE